MVMALADALHTLLRLPGATYSCVVERDSGRVLAELGRGEAGAGDSEGVVPYSVPRWGTAVAAMFDSTSGDELDDVMITGRRSYHLVRPLGVDASVLVYLRLDRSRSNLAAARRELAALRLAGSQAPVDPTPPATTPRAEPTARGSAAGARRKADAPAAASPAVPPARTPAALAPSTAPARGLRSASAPASAAAARPVPAGSAPARSASTRGASARSAPAPSAARSASTRPASARSTSSPAAVVPTRTRPIDDSAPAEARRIPLPRRTPGRSAPDGGAARRAEGGTRSGVTTAPDPVPEGFAVLTVLGQSWARDPGTLRRLLAGLRRMA